MGKYAGTRWPMDGTFSRIDDLKRLTYDARSWTEGEEETTTIHHANDVTLTADGSKTDLTLHVAITAIGYMAKLAAFGMEWGYKVPIDAHEKPLAHRAHREPVHPPGPTVKPGNSEGTSQRRAGRPPKATRR